MSNLVIVESPAKAKTIQKYLGSDYEVLASMGHVRDLPKSKLGVDVEHDFQPQYLDIKGKGDLIKKLKQTAAKSSHIYLATDPDREGEAISWHLSQMLGLNEEDPNRVTFNEITKSGVQSGMEHPRKIDLDLVNAQQARRILDRIVGYKISPFLWRKVRRGLSAGRVQSVAVRIIVDREKEIEKFKPEEYWTLDAKMRKKGYQKQFGATFYGDQKGKIKLHNKEEADAILAKLQDAEYIVSNVKKSIRRKSPAPPFITSTLQQEASRKLGFQARRTMKAAQELYEGVEVAGMGAVGLITYMRTDSLRISEEARAAATGYIRDTWGDKYLPEKPRYFKSRASAQDAHEAIRPTMPDLSPDKVKDSLTGDQYKLYKLIWERFIASLMANAVYDTVQADIAAGEYIFKASGRTVRFDGYTVLYEESKDDEEKEGGALPPLEKDDPLILKELKGNQHFTQPPPRYTEASLIKALEEKGIGRPSTYAPTITTILAREYVERDGKALKPTVLGDVITQLMKDHFKDIVDVGFTAHMEDDLDNVEAGKINWVDTLHQFYDGFEQTLEKAEKEMDGTRVKIPDEETDEVCELCGRKMVIKVGRFGKFLACPGYPECKNTKKLVKETGGFCPKCGARVLLKKSKKGRPYYGCENNPRCDFMTWDEPLKETCPKCGKSLFRKKGKNAKIYCANEECGYERAVEKK
ncbi:type I DNA topoisomerase [Solibaculum mannosilyticum]|uniref:DNA topoisomerase 1 n=1 Tax=Solibaculum mannosilyticum TaxID=2780922 RepID=A0A7I8D3D0_9FIRM|nr:type I DNA topoisomerase [Solibaculum mannosilyticum]BCI60242.1 DNA topoisomerase 1 [Solibaculum mannosilyticum]CZT55096.1 DNA topoisomerase 1 [Eubacteriaceae bacterium CHKCI005]